MTLIELVVFLANCVIGCVLGITLYAKSGSWLLGVAGVPVGFGFGVLAVLGVTKLADRWYGAFPLRPTCRIGACKSDDYSWDMELSRKLKGDVFTCKCGDRYLLKRRRFSELCADETTRPYMKRDVFIRRWRSSVD